MRVYLEQRSEIIPADERAWLEAWSHERRSLFEVIEASPGSFLGRDVLRGGEVRVTTIAVALQSGYESDAPTFEPGLFLLARVGEV